MHSDIATKIKHQNKRIKKYQQLEPEMSADIAYWKSPYYENSYYEPYNPDDLLRKFGGNKALDKYQKMKQDDAVKSALFVKKSAVVSSGWVIEPATQEENDKTIADDLQENIESYYSGNFESGILQILSALEYGFSVNEKIFGVENNRVVLKELKAKPPHSFEFHTDPFGNLKPDGFKQWTNNGGLISLPLNKFVYYPYNKEFGNWYGDSDLRAAYRSWFSKDILIKAWNIYLERCGVPLVIGKYLESDSSEERSTMQNIVDNLSFKTSALIPKGADIEFRESVRQSTSDFKNAIDSHNAMIMRSILVPRHLGFDETAGGSYALGKVNFDVFAWVVGRIRNELQEIINEQIIRPLTIYNFPNAKNFPKFKFNPLTEEDKDLKSKTIIEGIRAGAISLDQESENYLRGLLGMPEAVEQEPVKTKTEPEPKEYKFKRQLNKYEKKVDFALIQKTLTTDTDEAILELKDQLRKIRDDFTTQIVRKKIAEDKNIAAVSGIEFKYIRELSQKIEAILRSAYDNGKKSAKDTAKKADFVSKIGLTKGKAMLWIKEQSKILTGNISEALQNKSKQIILDGLSRGATTNDIVNLVDNAFEPFVAEEGWEGSVKDGMKMYTEVNTTIAQSFSNGLREYNLGLESEGWIEGYEYSAILDEATTEGCEELDGQIYGVSNIYLNEIAPPRHWNAIVEGEKVQTSNGEENIEKIKVGDMVIGHTGKMRRVYDVMSQAADSAVYEIEMDNGNKLKITAEHPVLTGKGWKRVDMLSCSDLIVGVEDVINNPVRVHEYAILVDANNLESEGGQIDVAD